MALQSPLTVQPYDYIADSNGRPLDKGRIYIGVANQDPEFYQIPVYLDAAMTKPIDQPIRTNDGFVDFAGSLSELYASAEVYSVKVLDKQGRKVLYKGDMTRKNLMSDALADLNQSIIDTQTAAQITLNAAVNSANTEVAQTVSLATAAIDTATTKSNKAATDADAAIKTLFENGGLPANRFKTLVDLQTSDLPNDSYALVSDDINDKNGVYVKEGGEWLRSKYDVFGQVSSLIEHSLSNDSDIVIVKDKNGREVYKATQDGEHYFVGLDGDLKTELDKRDNIYNDSANIAEIVDINNKKALIVNEFGELITAADGNLSAKVEKLLESSERESASGISSAYEAAEYADRVMIDFISEYEDIGDLLTVQQVNEASIFSHNVKFLRIPALNRVAKNQYMLFYEAREEIGDFDRISVGSAVITIDSETKKPSISKIRKLHESFTDESGKLRTFLNACGVLLDDGRIACMYTRRHETTEHELYLRFSGDMGESWSEYSDISSTYAEKGWNAVIPCSQGIVKRYGSNKGRIIFPVWTTGTAYRNEDFNSGYVYSDDNGESWSLGEFTNEPDGSECQIAENLNGDLLLNVRLGHHNPPQKFFLLKDGVDKYQEIEQSRSLTDDAIMSGLTQGYNQWDNTTPKLLYSVCKTSDRRGLYIHTSYDFGKNWHTYEVKRLATSYTSYTCVDNINAHYKFVIWEDVPSGRIRYAVISTKNLLEK